MQYRTLGKTGEKVSVLGYGCMRLPVIDNNYGKVDDVSAMKLVRYAVEHGVNYIDTSWPYHSLDQCKEGTSEPFVGNAVKEIGRDKVFIATKLPIWAVKTREDMDAFLDAQLKSLQTDYIDFYLVHNIMELTWYNVVRLGLADFLDKIKKSGKVRHIGFSFHDTPALLEKVLGYYDFEFHQNIINYRDTNFQAGMPGVRRSHSLGLGIVGMEPVMGGFLADYLPREALDIFAETGIKRSPAAWALRWAWDQPEVSILLSGMNAMEQVQENIALCDEADTPLSGEELSAIDRVVALLKRKDEIPCTECNKCSCPHGVFIPCCFSMYNSAKEFDLGKIPISEHSYGLVLKNTPQEASRCNDCGLCSWQCPQGIDIPTQLRKVARYFDNVKVGW